MLLSNWHPGGSYGASALDIGETAKFHGLAFLQYVTPPASAHAPANEQSNIGLEIPGTFWDSYSYKNDMLRLWHGSSVVEALHLVVADRYGITVQAAPGGWAFISANTATTHGIDFLGTLHPPGAPVHT